MDHIKIDLQLLFFQQKGNGKKKNQKSLKRAQRDAIGFLIVSFCTAAITQSFLIPF